MINTSKIKILLFGVLLVLYFYQILIYNNLKSDNEILKEEIKNKDVTISLLENNKNNLEKKINKNKKDLEFQILKINKNYESILKDKDANCKKAIKAAKRDHDEIYKNKIDLVNKEINKHIKINIEEFNNRGVKK